MRPRTECRIAIGSLIGLTFWIFIFLPFYYGPRDNSNQYTADEAGKNNPFYEAWEWATHDAITVYTLFLAMFTGVLSVVSIVQIRYLIRADETARVTAEAAKHSADAAVNAERAHVFVAIGHESVSELIKMAVTAGEIPPEIGPAGQITRPRLQYGLRNYGKTPATIHAVRHGTAIVPDILEIIRDYESAITVTEEPIHILGADEPSPWIWVRDLPTITINDARLIRRGANTFWFYGQIVYDDTFGWRRTLDFIWRLSGESGFRIVRYAEREEHIPENK